VNQNVDGTSLDQLKKQYDDNFLLQNQYGLGDVVLKLDSAKNIGHSPKLKRPWKGLLIVIEVKTPLLYQLVDRKGENLWYITTA
jgi:hypothetical protein